MDAKRIIEQYSPAAIASSLELERLRRDFKYCAEKLLKVAPKEPIDGGGLAPFRLNRAQLQMNRIAEAQQARDGWIRLTILKHRQPGCSTWASGLGYRMAALNPHTKGMIFAQDEDTSEHIMDIVKRFHDNMPDEYKPRIYARPADGLELVDPNSPASYRERRQGSTIHCQTARTAMAGTGHTLQFVQLSEASKYPYARDLWTNMRPAMPNAANTIVIIESTAHATNTWFRERCERAQHDKSHPYQFIFTPWFYSDDYRLPLMPGEKLKLSLEEKQRVERYGLDSEQVKWYRFQLDEFGGDDMAAELMKQEYPEEPDDAWIDLTASVFDTKRLFGYLRDQKGQANRACDIAHTRKDTQLWDNHEGAFHIWHTPEAGEAYDIGVDVASGDEESSQDLDFSVCSVVRRRDRTQVAEWRSREVDPIDLAQVAYNIGTLYNRAQIAIEVSGIGYSTNAELHKLGYSNIYLWRTRGEAVEKLTRQTGWSTSNTSKNHLVATARHHIVNERLSIRSPVLWQEMTTFTKYVTPSGLIGYGAPPGYHDDTVMAFMIAIVIGDDERAGDGFQLPNERPANREEALRNYVQANMRDNMDFAQMNQQDPLTEMASMLEGRV